LLKKFSISFLLNFDNSNLGNKMTYLAYIWLFSPRIGSLDVVKSLFKSEHKLFT